MSTSRLLSTDCLILRLQIQQVACGGFHTLMLSEEGRIFVFGSNCFGQVAPSLAPFTSPTLHSWASGYRQAVQCLMYLEACPARADTKEQPTQVAVSPEQQSTCDDCVPSISHSQPAASGASHVGTGTVSPSLLTATCMLGVRGGQEEEHGDVDEFRAEA
eukprot:750414-Hanusia_phi.AAC.3